MRRMRRAASRATVAIVVLALFPVINCHFDTSVVVSSPAPDFEGCFQGRDDDRSRIVLVLESPRTMDGQATDVLSGCLFYVEDKEPPVIHTISLDGGVEDEGQLSLTATPGGYTVVVTLDEGDIADPDDDTVTVDVPGESRMGPIDKRGPPPSEEMCPTLRCPLSG